jgi:hypothetical protein
MTAEMTAELTITVTRVQGVDVFRRFDISINGSPIYSGATGDSPEHVGKMVAAYIQTNEVR